MLPFNDGRKALKKYGHNNSDDEMKLIRKFNFVLLGLGHQVPQSQIRKETSGTFKEPRVITLQTTSL